MNYPNVERVCENPHHDWKTKRNDELAKSLKPISRPISSIPEKHKRIAVKIAQSTNLSLAAFVLKVSLSATRRWINETKHRS